jgi:hypothetical protein
MLIINKAILHVVDNVSNRVLISDEELDFESETCYEFITRHVKRLLTSPQCRTATFLANSRTYAEISEFINRNTDFKTLSVRLTERLASIMYENPDIPPSDILYVRFTNNDVGYLAIIKLNYNEFFVRRNETGDSGKIDNQIIKFQNALPLNAAKVDEACVIPLDPAPLKLIEKYHEINYELENYFSKYFLEAETNISKSEAVEIISEVHEYINRKYYDDKIDTLAEISNALIEETEKGDGAARLENVAAILNGDAKDEYIEKIREAGIVYDLELGEKYVKRQFGRQKFVAENGIEIKFPSEIISDGSIEFKYFDDGSVTITLNNLRKKSL